MDDGLPRFQISKTLQIYTKFSKKETRDEKKMNNFPADDLHAAVGEGERCSQRWFLRVTEIISEGVADNL